jgi:glutamate/tyrosine decarboxylase-like PLP-dependent enzyme
MTPPPTDIWPDRRQRLAEQSRLSIRLADALDAVQAGRVAHTPAPAALRAALGRFDFRTPQSTSDVIDAVTVLLQEGMVHVMHPGYFGLFNPSVAFPALLADQITAAFNPQLAVWSHAAAANEIELHTLKAFAGRFGWSDASAGGHFTSGGSEANLTAVVCALTHAFPRYGDEGALAIGGSPKLYVSAESHLAWLKIAHQCGIGRDAVRLVATDGLGQMDEGALSRAIEADTAQGHRPFFICATAGTTNAGMIDPIKACARIADSNGLWLHVDAAWGGAAILSAKPSGRFEGVELADSITLDAHKWLATPMGAGMLLCRREAVLAEAFRVSATYMPSAMESVCDPYTHSVQWSRRFIGLRLFMALAVLGWDGYQSHIDSGLELADQLAALLRENGWKVVNDSPLGVVCFVDALGAHDPVVIAERVVADGRAWISSARFEGRPVLRACITSHFTRFEHLEMLVAALDDARRAAMSARP